MEINKEPNLIDKAKSLSTAAVNWAAKDGFQRVSEEQFQARKNICLACPNWDSTAFNGMGKCRLCGCTGMKLYIPSARCPDNPPRWDIVKVS
jgi:hypothetical protein